jgi:hypothetical protein
VEQDQQYLKIIAIFHFVVGGIAGLISCFPIIHLVLGLTFLFGNFSSVQPTDTMPMSLFGLVFTVIPALIILLGWAFAICVMLAGYFNIKRQHHMFCLVMAGVECMFMPFGTVLGVFSIILLIKPEVKALFAPNLPPVTA